MDDRHAFGVTWTMDDFSIADFRMQNSDLAKETEDILHYRLRVVTKKHGI